MEEKQTFKDEVEQWMTSQYHRGIYNALLCVQKKGFEYALECYVPIFLKEPEEDGLVRNCKIFSIVEVK